MYDRTRLTAFVMSMSLPALIAFAVPAQAASDSLVPSIKEQKYISLAARVVATADACTALGVIDPGVGFLDDIEVGMMDLGASQEEVEEWISTVASAKSPAIQSILKSENQDAVWLQCTKDIDEKRRQLAAILSGEQEDAAPEGAPAAPEEGR